MAILGIKDIAALANVSPATVSRVISSPDMVSKKTLNKVKKIIDEVGYRPNRMGASLRTRKSGILLPLFQILPTPLTQELLGRLNKERKVPVIRFYWVIPKDWKKESSTMLT